MGYTGFTETAPAVWDGKEPPEGTPGQRAPGSSSDALRGLEFKGKKATIGETREAVTTMWSKLGGTIACALLAFACRGASPGCAKVSDLVDQEVVTNAAVASAAVPSTVATNAIPWSGGPVEVSVESNGTLSCSGEWPLARPVFVVVTPEGPYERAGNVRIVGYSSWPSRPWQGVAWRVDETYYFNVLTELER